MIAIVITILISLPIISIPLLIVFLVLGWLRVPYVAKTLISSIAAFLFVSFVMRDIVLLYAIDTILLCALLLLLGRKRIANETKSSDAPTSIFK